MAPNTPALAFKVELDKAPWEQEVPMHNRWHPAIPVASTQKTGQLFRVECCEWTGGQIKDNDSAQDMKDIDLSQVRI
jgi:formamidase